MGDKKPGGSKRGAALIQDEPVKRMVIDQTPRKIVGLKFGIMTPQEIQDQSVLQVSDRRLYMRESYNGQSRTIASHGPLDGRMGTSSSGNTCTTCNKGNRECNGHFGYAQLTLPVFHIGFFKKILDVLNCICKDCGHVLLSERIKRQHLLAIRKASNDMQLKKDRLKKIMMECRKTKRCPYCNAVNGTIKKVAGQALKIFHEKYRAFTASNAKSKKPPTSKIKFDLSFQTAKKKNPDIERHSKKAMDDLNPLKVRELFQKIPDVDCEVLGMDPAQFRPEIMIWTCIPIPPVPIRPSVQQESASTEDDITNKIGDILHMSNLILVGLKSGQKIQSIMEQWDFLQVQVAMYINSEVPNLQNHLGSGKMIRGFCQRLKGKQGRFRGNLSGKRVNFSGRTVISPDPNLEIDEVAVPQRVAVNLSYPERVNQYNIDRLKQAIRNGPKWPGAKAIWKGNNEQLIKYMRGPRLENALKQLQVGDIVDRHLIDGDIVLFNRQPSLHKLSIMCHKVKVRQWRTFRLNECVCSPYNADFDGDEMNLHVPQTEEARAEALELMGVKYNLATPKNGTPIIAATQDFLTASFLLSNKERFYDRSSFCQIVSYMFDARPAKEPVSKHHPARLGDGTAFLDIEIPQPAIIKPRALWTGKQVFNVLMRPNKQSKVKVNFDAAGRNFGKEQGMPKDLNADDQFIVVRNSEIMCGVMDKNILGDGKKDSIFYVMMRDFGQDVAIRAMSRLAKLSARWLSNEGFSIGISDVYPGQKLVERKQELIRNAYQQCDELILKCKQGKLPRDAGCDEQQTMENKISGLLSKLRETAGAICFAELSRWNSAVIMARCGSKGSNLNVSQMVAAVGQQIIGGSRVSDGFQDRTLPHFAKAAPLPAAKGFVSNSFFSGLTPTEFIFHAMSGREGLVDTAVKTAETGYMSRRLMKSLEDLAVSYDSTVRNSTKTVVQFQFGEDGLDPVDMEGKAKPVNFERTWLHVQTSYWDPEDEALDPVEVRALTREHLNKQWLQVSGGVSKTDDDLLESVRTFFKELTDFMDMKADALAQTRFTLEFSESAKAGKLETTELWKDLDKISLTILSKFLRLCFHKYSSSKVQPGHAVGAVGAQSIGEPGTQMTLKTFHFAGIAGMSITQGVPRIKEIINASKEISTPIIQCELQNKFVDFAARCVKGAIEKTYLADVVKSIREVWEHSKCKLVIEISMKTIQDLGLAVTLPRIRYAIVKTRGLKMKDSDVTISPNSNTIRITVGEDATLSKARRGKRGSDEETHFQKVQALRRLLPSIPICGYPDATRAVISKGRKDPKTGQEPNMLMVEGYGLKQCMTTGGVVGESTYTNNIAEMYAVLGVEAARASIIKELQTVMGEQMDIDPRHMQLLADVMTYKGMILGITRFGLAKMRDSVLQLASFEKTPDHLFDAAIGGKVDLIEGVSESIIMGQNMRIGTGAMEVVRHMGWRDGDFKKEATLLSDMFDGVEKQKTKSKGKGKSKKSNEVRA